MKKKAFAFGLIILIGIALFVVFINNFNNGFVNVSFANNKKDISTTIDKWFKNIDSIPLPNGFKRITSPDKSFGFIYNIFHLKKIKRFIYSMGRKREIKKLNSQ